MTIVPTAMEELFAVYNFSRRSNFGIHVVLYLNMYLELTPRSETTMLSALLASIQTQLGSKGFLLGNLLPVMLFVFGNGTMLYRHWNKFQAWIVALDTLQEKTLLVTMLTIVIITLAYVFSAFNPTLLELLEGKKGLLHWVAPLLYRLQWGKLQRLEKQYHAWGNELINIERALSDTSDQPDSAWITQLRTARQKGGATNRCNRAWAQSHDTPWVMNSKAYAVRKVLWRRKYGCSIKYKDLQSAVTALDGLLRENSANIQDDKASQALGRMHLDLQDVIYFARDYCEFERLRLYNQRQFNYPGSISREPERTSNTVLAPTTLGNIGRTIRSYALTRYNLDLDIFWSRLQNSVQNSKDYFSVLQDVKVRTDCLIALVWLTGLFSVIWAPLLLFGSSVLEFLLVGAIGFLSLGLYSLACESYRVFADLMRSAIDLFRFKLLNDCHLPLPNSSYEEQALWERLGNVSGYAQKETLLYRH